jgi:hypothetical protein
MKNIVLFVVISVSALTLMVLHIIFPKVQIDAISLLLFALAASPWLIGIFRKLELPGGISIEFREELDKITSRAEQAGLLREQKGGKRAEYTFENLTDDDPRLALAGLRIEIEKRLRHLALGNKIPVGKGGVRRLLTDLERKKLLGTEEIHVIQDLVVLLNSAIHVEEIDAGYAKWAFDIGPKLLASLDFKFKAQSADKKKKTH